MSRLIFQFFFLLLIPELLSAQIKRYTFEQCVEMAISRNLDLKMQVNQVKKATINTKESKWGIAPNISGSATSSLNLRRSTNQNNQIASGTNYNLGYNIGGSLLLFNGLTRMNSIAANKYLEMSYKESTRILQNQLYLNIANIFSKTLYIKELISVSEERLSVNELEQERIVTNIELGLLEKVAALEIKATISSNKLELKRLQNEYKLALIELAQVIDYTDSENFEISDENFTLIKPTENSYTVASVYDMACVNLPEVRAREYQLQYMKKNVQIARGRLFPTLRVNGGYSSAFYSTDTLSDGSKTPISNQFKNYLNPSLNMSLNVPIFYGASIRFNIKRQKLNFENSMLEIENEKNTIKKEIESTLVQLNALQLEYLSAIDNLNYSKQYFESYRERFSIGLANSTDFNLAQNQLSKAKANVASARFNWIVQEKIIKVYTGEALIPSFIDVKH